MEGQAYGIQWITADLTDIKATQLIEMSNGVDNEYVIGNDEANIQQIAAENLIFMASDGQMVTEIITAKDEHCSVVISPDDNGVLDVGSISTDGMTNHSDTESRYIDFESTSPQIVTEEVITDDWVQHDGEDRVEIAAEQIIGSSSQILLDIEVPLHTTQDEYTSKRPFPCDFCSRRFRKHVTLMNHMVTHQGDRPLQCKLCNTRFVKRSELINHLKSHAYDNDFVCDESKFNVKDQVQTQEGVHNQYYDNDWDMQNDTSLETKSLQKAHISENSSFNASTSVRGRVSRLKLNNDKYSVTDSIKSHSNTIELLDCEDDLQASTAVVKIAQDETETQERFPIIDENKPFVCQQCGLAFAREKALSSHSKNHIKDAVNECNQCNEIFWDASSLQDHMKTHQFEDSNSEFDPADADLTQTDSEPEQTYGEYYCSECGMSFHRKNLLLRHKKLHGENKMTNNFDNEDNKDHHNCNTCGETFAEALDLLAHAEIHARYPPFKCVLCGESFFEEVAIKRHLESKHASEMTQNSCILCGKECRDRKALMKHSWDHSREKCHSCSKCGKSFHNKARLKRHMASHRDKTVICNVCYEEFPDGRSLSNHRHSHSANSSGKLFPCIECGKTFGSRSSQQIHVRIHTGERPYGCRFCWKAFADGGTLRKHERIHTGEKPYACSVCPRAFNQRVVLREHIRSHHSGLDAKRGIYYCTVCGEQLNSSADLIQHLIQHSDKNTAMQRQPITGPRKYKRRRKLKPHELAHLRDQSLNDSDMDLSDLDVDVDDLLVINESDTSKLNETTNAKNSKRNTSVNNCSVVGKEQTNKDTRKKSTRKRNVSTSSADKLWQTKLINSSTKSETYKSMLSNIENTLQTLDTLVVDYDGFNSECNVEHRNNEIKLENKIPNTIEHQVQDVNFEKCVDKEAIETVFTTHITTRNRKKAEKTVKNARPRMIHTEKLRVANKDNTKKRSKTLISRTETAKMELLSKSKEMQDDFEIMSPAAQPPNEISRSPIIIKQEQQINEQTEHYPQQYISTAQITPTTRNDNLYETELLLEASALRKESYEKFNPHEVNDLDDILRSPLKSERSDRQRFTSESSTQYLTDTTELQLQNLIKIERSSPDLRDIYASVSGSGSSGEVQHNHAGRRSTRSRLTTVNRKFLDFETDILSRCNGSPQKRNNTQPSKSKPAKNRRQQELTNTQNSFLDYNVNHYSNINGNSSASSSYSTISASGASETNAQRATTQPERRRPVFECEMCSLVFTDRAQLLDHVPIHI